MSHATLSPSAASKWIACPPSARLELTFPQGSSSYADEGSLAHTYAELELSRLLKRINEKPYLAKLAEITEHALYAPEMDDYVKDYCAYVMEQYAEAQTKSKDAVIFLEEKTDLTEFIEDGFGTVDVKIIADGTLHIIDLKYGKGVPVSAEENKQLMIYAVGVIREYISLYDFDNVCMHIVQPRLDSISSYQMSVIQLVSWAEEIVKPAALLAFAGKGEFKAGSHCRFCKAKAVCCAFAEEQMQLAQYEFKKPELLTDEEVADILTRSDVFINWIGSINEHALKEALNGKEWPGHKLVEGKSLRKYTDEKAVLMRLLEKKYMEEEITETKLLGITKLEKVIGKTDFNSYLNDLIIKPSGAPTLVPESDKRPKFHKNEEAAKDFGDI